MKGSLKACFHWQWIWTQSFSWSGKSTYDPVKMEKKKKRIFSMNILPDNISGCLFGEFKSKVSHETQSS